MLKSFRLFLAVSSSELIMFPTSIKSFRSIPEQNAFPFPDRIITLQSGSLPSVLNANPISLKKNRIKVCNWSTYSRVYYTFFKSSDVLTTKVAYSRHLISFHDSSEHCRQKAWPQWSSNVWNSQWPLWTVVSDYLWPF